MGASVRKDATETQRVMSALRQDVATLQKQVQQLQQHQSGVQQVFGMVPSIVGKIDQLNLVLDTQAKATQESVDTKVAALEAKLAVSSQSVEKLAAQVAAQSAVQVKASQYLASQVSQISTRLGVTSIADLPSPTSVRPPTLPEPEATPCAEREVPPESTSPPHARLPEPSEPESELSVEPSSAARIEVKAESTSATLQAPTGSTAPTQPTAGQNGSTGLTNPTQQSPPDVAQRQDSLTMLSADEAFDRLLQETAQGSSAASTSGSTFPNNTAPTSEEWKPFG